MGFRKGQSVLAALTPQSVTSISRTASCRRVFGVVVLRRWCLRSACSRLASSRHRRNICWRRYHSVSSAGVICTRCRFAHIRDPAARRRRRPPPRSSCVALLCRIQRQHKLTKLCPARHTSEVKAKKNDSLGFLPVVAATSKREFYYYDQ